MRKPFAVLAAASALIVLAGLQLASGQGGAEPGFTPLFNGKNLDGWREAKGKKEPLDGKTEAVKGRFKVTDGKLVIEHTVKGDSYIETAREFGKDVHIKLEFSPGPKCNNDFLIRGTKFDIVPGNKENKSVKEGEWYSLDIVITGDKIEHKVNGETARTSKAAAKSTSFVVRGEIGGMQIKNIRAKE